MGCCNCTQKVEISFGGPLKIMMVDEEQPQGCSFLTVTTGQFSFTGRDHVMYTLPVGMGVKMEVSYVDAGGNPAEVDDIKWQSSNDAIVKIETNTDDPSVVQVLAVDEIGQVQVSAVADVDLGSGVKNIVTIADIEVVAGEAVAGTISPVGEPSPIEPAQKK